ncbi:COG4280 domain-containing protein [Bosea sp. TAF32]|uniref:COG4280 domain-containing protein n=1 Tax=Bosea sp. TAF32 TaxID=3237482 RepID=UPI003F8E633D
MTWTMAAPALSAAFLASLVEVVEAFTIVLAVGTVRGWRPALIGTGCALAVLALLVLLLGSALTRVPLQALQLVIGVLLMMFGLRWLRKAILRATGFIALHDEEAAFIKETGALQGGDGGAAGHHDWIAGLTAFKAVMLEGIEVVFIVLAVGAGRGLLWPASLGALAACALVLALGLVLRKPLASVPENTLKFAVGVMISAFGIYWTGEGLGVDWPGGDFAIPALAALLLASGLTLAATFRRNSMETAA